MRIWRIILTGAILTGLPLAAIARHIHNEVTDIRIELPVEIMTELGSERLLLKSSISTLNLKDINGADRVDVGDSIFVHMARGPDKLAYPFAVTRNSPTAENRSFVFSIKGQISYANADLVKVSYPFENFVARPALIDRLNDGPAKQSSIELIVKPNRVARLAAVKIEDQRYDHPVIEKPELFGFTHLGAKTIPAK